MNNIVDFNVFKYSREDCYIELFINRNALSDIEGAIQVRLDNFYMSKDEECAYIRLRDIFEYARKNTENLYAQVKINKCFIRYITNLHRYFGNRNDYISLRVLNEYLQIILIDEIDRMSDFSYLSEEYKIDILSHI